MGQAGFLDTLVLITLAIHRSYLVNNKVQGFFTLFQHLNGFENAWFLTGVGKRWLLGVPPVFRTAPVSPNWKEWAKYQPSAMKRQVGGRQQLDEIYFVQKVRAQRERIWSNAKMPRGKGDLSNARFSCLGGWVRMIWMARYSISCYFILFMASKFFDYVIPAMCIISSNVDKALSKTSASQREGV